MSVPIDGDVSGPTEGDASGPADAFVSEQSARARRIDEGYMREALLLADQAAAAGEVPVGALVTLDDAIIGRGHNRSLVDHDPSAHAEVIALREGARARGSFRIDGATLYVTLEPCLMCCGALLQARIVRVVFGAREPRTGAIVSVHETLMTPNATHHVAVTEGVLAVECRRRLSDFFAERRQQQ